MNVSERNLLVEDNYSHGTSQTLTDVGLGAALDVVLVLLIVFVFVGFEGGGNGKGKGSGKGQGKIGKGNMGRGMIIPPMLNAEDSGDDDDGGLQLNVVN